MMNHVKHGFGQKESRKNLLEEGSDESLQVGCLLSHPFFLSSSCTSRGWEVLRSCSITKRCRPRASINCILFVSHAFFPFVNNFDSGVV